MHLNRHSIFALIGVAALFVPDLTGLAAWLAGQGVPWLTYVARGLGGLALLVVSIDRIRGKLAPVLAQLEAQDSTAKPGTTAAIVQAAPLPSSSPTPLTVPIRPKDKGSVEIKALIIVALVGLIACLTILWAYPARADGDHPYAPGASTDGDHPVRGLGCVDGAGTWCVFPASAVAWQLNLKTGDVRKGAILAGLVLQHRFGSLPVGLGVYGGLGMGADGSSYQGCVGVSITNWGLLCGGTQRVTFDSGATAWQGVLSLALQMPTGATP